VPGGVWVTAQLARRSSAATAVERTDEFIGNIW
jgi:hypothetical protein